MNRNVTPRPIRATGTGDAHGRILERDAGAMYVHMHRELGLAHRHYVLSPWQVRALALMLSRPMLVLYVVALVSWGWAAGQAARVPVLQLQVSQLRADARRLDTLTATMAELQARYDQVQTLLRAATATRPDRASSERSEPVGTPAGVPAAVPAAVPPASVRRDSLRRDTTRRDTTRRDTTRTPSAPVVRDSGKPLAND